jgi:single-strand DNA-binding protein
MVDMLNKAILMGRLVADPELRHTNGDIAVTSFTLAVDRTFVKAGTERQADFIKIVCWRQTAEFASKYFRKGQLVAIEGPIQTGSYTDSQGNKKYTFEIVADNVHFAEARKDNQGSAPSNSPDNKPGQNDNMSSDNGDFVEIDGDDDLPF